MNGDFEKPDVKKGWTVKDEIPGWKGKGIEIGYGQIYNKNWNSQIVELDGHEPVSYTHLTLPTIYSV